LMGKRLGQRLTELVNGGGAAARIWARKWRSEGGTDGQRWGLPQGARSGDGGGKEKAEARRHHLAPFWEGQVRQRAVGVGKPGRSVDEAGHEQGEGVPANR
jgi:hypothetical protein